MACINWHECWFKGGGVAHFYVAKASVGGIGRGMMATARCANVRFRLAILFAFLKFGQHHASDINFAATNMAVHVNRAGHDNFAA